MATKTVTYIRHAKQTSHQMLDPPIQLPPPTPGLVYDRIICSPYLRCRQTATYFSTPNPILVDVRISEYHGHKSKKRISTMDSSSLTFGPIPLLTESWPECQHRLEEHWKWVASISDASNILVVTHGVVVNYMHEKFTGQKLRPRGRDVGFGTGFSIPR